MIEAAGSGRTSGRAGDDVLANPEDLALLRAVSTGSVMIVAGNFGSGVMTLPLEDLVGSKVADRLRTLAGAGLVIAGEVGPPSLTEHGRKLISPSQRGALPGRGHARSEANHDSGETDET